MKPASFKGKHQRRDKACDTSDMMFQRTSAEYDYRIGWMSEKKKHQLTSELSGKMNEKVYLDIFCIFWHINK